jgi:hypothetical protein
MERSDIPLSRKSSWTAAGRTRLDFLEREGKGEWYSSITPGQNGLCVACSATASNKNSGSAVLNKFIHCGIFFRYLPSNKPGWLYTSAGRSKNTSFEIHRIWF